MPVAAFNYAVDVSRGTVWRKWFDVINGDCLIISGDIVVMRYTLHQKYSYHN